MKKLFLFAIITICFCTKSNAQLTTKDFKLYLDDIASSDSPRIITKEQFLHAHKVSANFSWLKINQLIIYMGEGNYTSEIVTYVCKGDTLTKEFKDTYGPRMSSGLPITISIEAVNRQNQPIEWSSISIVLK